MTAGRRTDPRIQQALNRAVELGELGVQVAAYLRGRLIVNDWIGDATVGTPEEVVGPVDARTLFPVFSVTKGVVSTALHLQAERGLVDYESPVATYWPEFAAHGKGSVTVRHVLSHRSGVPQMPAGVTRENMADWSRMVTGIADLVPVAPAGTKSTYSAITYTWILGEVVRRTDPNRRPFGRFVREELCAPLGMDDLWLGLPESENHRVAKVVGKYPGPPSDLAPLRQAAAPSALVTGPESVNYPSIWRSSRTVITNATSIARMFAMLANGGEFGGVRLLSQARVRSFTVPRSRPDEYDEVIGQVHGAGLNGYWLGGPYPPADPVAGESPSVISYPGAGGSIGWADIDTGLAVAICHNRMFSNNPPLPIEDHPLAAVGRAIRDVAADISAH